MSAECWVLGAEHEVMSNECWVGDINTQSAFCDRHVSY